MFLISSIYCSLETGRKKSKALYAVHHLSFEFCLLINVLVTIVYWTVLDSSAMKEFEGSYFHQLHARTQHITPIVCTLINFYLTDIHMKYEHYELLLPFLQFYNIVHFTFTKVTGIVPYWFANWEDITTPIVITTLSMLFIGLYFALAWMT